MRITRKGVAVSAIAGVMAVGAALPAIGQDATETPTEQATDGATEDRHAGRRSEFAAALAEELGIDQVQVEQALTAVQERLRGDRQAEVREQLEARLAEAVENGDLDREQADAILDAFDAGVFPGPGRAGRGLHRGFGPRIPHDVPAADEA